MLYEYICISIFNYIYIYLLFFLIYLYLYVYFNNFSICFFPKFSNWDREFPELHGLQWLAPRVALTLQVLVECGMAGASVTASFVATQACEQRRRCYDSYFKMGPGTRVGIILGGALVLEYLCNTVEGLAGRERWPRLPTRCIDGNPTVNWRGIGIAIGETPQAVQHSKHEFHKADQLISCIIDVGSRLSDAVAFCWLLIMTNCQCIFINSYLLLI